MSTAAPPQWVGAVKKSTAVNIPFQARQDDHQTPQTGIASGSWATKRLKKTGGSFADITPTVTEDENGQYYVVITTELNTDGFFTIQLTYAGTDIVTIQGIVIEDDPTVSQASLGVASIGTGGITSGSFAAGAVNSAAIAADAIGASQIADNAIDAGAIAAGAITSAKFAAGAITSTVIAADAIGASQIAADAIGASELAADAVTEIQAGLATASALSTAQTGITEIASDTDTIITNVAALPTAAAIGDEVLEELIADHSGVGGSLASYVSALTAIDNNVIDIQGDVDGIESTVATLATAAALATAQTAITEIATDTDSILTRLPAALVGGRMDSSVGALGAGGTTAIAAAVLDAMISGHLTAGTVGESIWLAFALANGMYMVDNTTNTSDGLTAARLRVFTSQADVAAATDGGSGEGEIAVIAVATTYDSPGKINTFKARRTS